MRSGKGTRAHDYEELVVEFDAIAGLHAEAERGDFAVDLGFAVLDTLFEQATRAEAGVGQHLVQAFLEHGAGIGLLRPLEGQGAALWRGHFGNISQGR